MKWIILFSLPFMVSFFPNNEKEIEKNFISSLLNADTSKIVKEIFENSEKYRLQIAFTQVVRESKNRIKLKTYTYRTDENEYFYPASMVKVPVAGFALEKLTDIVPDSVLFDSLIIKTINPKTNSINSSIKLNDDLRRLFVVSDNNAFNDLYDLVGQEYINRRLSEMGYKDARIIQKLMGADSIGHRTSYPVQLLTTEGQLVYERGVDIAPVQLINKAEKNIFGKAYYDGKKLIHRPKDFTISNYIPLSDLHEMLISLIYPQEVSSDKRFKLTDRDYQLLQKYMSMYPRETGNSEWSDESIYYDSFRKYLLVGNSRSRIDSCLKIFNKVGQAYGFMTDCAYIIDYRNDVEFFLSATLYVNKNEVLNDGIYEYQTLGFPFFERLGQIFYNYELDRDRTILSRKNK